MLHPNMSHSRLHLLHHPHHAPAAAAAAAPPPQILMHRNSIKCFVLRPKAAGAASGNCLACFSVQQIFPPPPPPPPPCFILSQTITQLQLRRNGQFGSKARAHLIAGAEAVDDAVSASSQDFEEEEEEKEKDDSDVKGSVLLLKDAAKTRKVPPAEVFMALRSLEKAKLDPSAFPSTIGGTQSPGRTWMLVFTASDRKVKGAVKAVPGGGFYVPVTAVQRFDAETMSIENGIYLGPLGFLTFQGRYSWNKAILSFIFTTLNLKIGSFGPFKFDISKKEDQDREPGKKDPFFIWYYADDELIVARGRSGGLAFWCRCTKVAI